MRVLVLALIFACSPPSISQSFDCSHGSVPRARAVCESSDLRDLDSQLAAEYKRVHDGVSPLSAAFVLADERVWLRSSDAACTQEARGKTTLAECLIGEYKVRLDELRQDLDLGDGHWLLRTHGSGSLFPVIEPATPKQADWNHAARAIVSARRTRAIRELKQCQTNGADLPASMRGNLKVIVDWRIAAANAHLITLRFHHLEYCGGAHPLAGFEDWSWSLATGTLLASSEVFQASSRWQKPVIALAKERLLKLEDFSTYSGDNMISGADTIVRSTNQWQPNRDGLRLQFQQYQVAAYVFGMLSITIPWSELKPYLKSTWHPEQLHPDFLIRTTNDLVSMVRFFESFRHRIGMSRAKKLSRSLRSASRQLRARKAAQGGSLPRMRLVSTSGIAWSG